MSPFKTNSTFYPKKWGEEEWICNDESSNICGKFLRVKEGKAFSTHFHDLNMNNCWMVCNGKKWIGVIETNFEFAIRFWTKKGLNLFPWNDSYLNYPYIFIP